MFAYILSVHLQLQFMLVQVYLHVRVIVSSRSITFIHEEKKIRKLCGGKFVMQKDADGVCTSGED
jgi:hypothetical protein